MNMGKDLGKCRHHPFFFGFTRIEGIASTQCDCS